MTEPTTAAAALRSRLSDWFSGDPTLTFTTRKRREREVAEAISEIEREAADAERARIAGELAGLRRTHLIVEGDCWFSCPAAVDEDGNSECCDDTRAAARKCDCGADAHNARLDALLTAGAPDSPSKP